MIFTKKIYVPLLIKVEMQLISGRDNGEQELVRFLKPYKRVTSPQLCAQNITLPQLTLWVYVNGQWVRKDGKKMKGDQTRSGSWCHLYLGSGYTPNQYAKIKRDLFASSKGLSGVYQDKANQLYAVVYKPTMQLSNAAIAALVGGTALAGVAGAKYARRSTPKEQASKTAAPPTRDELRQKLKQILDDGADKNLGKEDFKGLDDDFEKMTTLECIKEERDLLLAIREAIYFGSQRLSQIAITNMKNQSAIDIARTIDARIDARKVQKYLPKDLQEKYEAASIISRLIKSAEGDSVEFNLNGTTMKEFELGFERCRESPENCEFTKAWFDLVHEFNDRPDLLAKLYELIKNVQNGITKEEREQIIENEKVLIREAKEYIQRQGVKFEQQLRLDKTPTISPEDIRKFKGYYSIAKNSQSDENLEDVDNLMHKITALQKLNMSQRAAMDAIRAYSRSKDFDLADSKLVVFANNFEGQKNNDIEAFNRKRSESHAYDNLKRLAIQDVSIRPELFISAIAYSQELRVLQEVKSNFYKQLTPDEQKTLDNKITELSSWSSQVQQWFASRLTPNQKDEPLPYYQSGVNDFS
jgi:hypothetical protein